MGLLVVPTRSSGSGSGSSGIMPTFGGAIVPGRGTVSPVGIDDGAADGAVDALGCGSGSGSAVATRPTHPSEGGGCAVGFPGPASGLWVDAHPDAAPAATSAETERPSAGPTMDRRTT